MIKPLISNLTTRFFLALCVVSVFAGSPAAANDNQVDLLSLYLRASLFDAELAAAEADYEAAKTAVSLARSNVRPQASFGYQLSFTDVNSDSQGSFVDQGPSLSLRQTIFNKIHLSTIDQAKASTKQAEAQLEAQRQDLILRVSEAYFDVLEAESELAFRRSELDAIERQKEQNERRFDVGLVAITDVKDAQAQFDLATAQEIAAANQVAAAQEALTVLTGANIGAIAQLRDNAPLISPTPEDPEQWINTAQDQNLPLRVAELAVLVAKAELAGSRAERYPTLDLVGLATQNTTTQGLSSDVDVGEIRLELNLPLLSGGRTTAMVRQTKAQLRAARHQEELQRRVTIQQTRNAYRNVVANIAQANALKQALESTQKSLEAQEAGFAEGLLTSLEVLRSLRDTFQAQSDYAAARYQYIDNFLLLKSSAGILNESDVELINGWLEARPSATVDASSN